MVTAVGKQEIIVAIAGKFDPIHEGHLDHIHKAYALGDYLIIITHPDDIVAKTSKKGVCLQTLFVRRTLLKGILKLLGGKGKVVVAWSDIDGTVAKTLEIYKPTIFAKGGDRVPGNLPQNEIDICQKYGIEIRYGIGDLLGSSSDMCLKVL